MGNPPASTMFSYAVLNDDRQHGIELLLNGKNLTMRVDGGLARSLINLGSKVFDSDKNGSISSEELETIISNLFHLVPEMQRVDLPTPQKVRYRYLINSNFPVVLTKFSERVMEEMDTDRDGVISKDEFVMAFLRNELLSTNIINKIMTRFTSAKTCILEV